VSVPGFPVRHLNRLYTAGKSGASFTYSPDPYGNMTCTATGGPACTPLGLSFNTTNNRINSTGYSYDAAGNLLSDNTHGYVYDAENRVTCVLGSTGTCNDATAVNYYYAPGGERIAKVMGTTVEEYVYDPQGHVTSAHDATTATLWNEIYDRDGRHVATKNSNGFVWNLADWLGTERVRTNSSGTVIESCTDTPYGMNTACAGSDTSPMHFTGLQYDAETGMSHTLNRQYPMNLARWLTPDPGGLKVINLEDPQTWNLYAYVRNNPLTLTDPTGLDMRNQSADTQAAAAIGLAVDGTWWRRLVAKGKAMLHDYTKDPGPPGPKPAPVPGTPKWTYQQSTGDMDLKIGTAVAEHAGTGYAGHGNGKNDPDSQGIEEPEAKKDRATSNAGPLNRGEYTVGPIRDNSTGEGTVLHQSMRLFPSPNNDMSADDGKTRGGFLIHRGDMVHQTSSQGCVVLPDDGRKLVGASGIRVLEVVR
jgi:RHS repeat-associated protein